MTTSAPILLLTHSGDYYTIDLVEQALVSRGVPALRVDTDRFPVELALSVSFRSGREEMVLRTPRGAVALREVPAVWNRRVWPGAMPETMDPRYVQHCRRESRTALVDALSLMDGAFWVNTLQANTRAESKLLQLRVAQELGFTLPPTLVTNNPDEVRAFHAELGGRMVTKLLGVLTVSMQGTSEFFYTTEVTEADLAAIDDVRYAPQIFQATVGKRCELRVVVVGSEVFTGAIDTRGSRRGRVDWRLTQPGEGIDWTPYTLPDDETERVLALMRRLGLVSAALDFIVDPEGRHVFLEVNPAGEWGWLQRDLGFPIAERIADALVEGSRR
ncbi:MAG: MvdC/MvdD family ATP grasp protein [Myxococcota bacterium]